jgi:hypothetical protein
MGLRQGSKNIVNDAIIKEIAEAAESLDYGTITIKVHGAKIIQIEVTEKKRFDDVWKVEEGGGI